MKEEEEDHDRTLRRSRDASAIITAIGGWVGWLCSTFHTKEKPALAWSCERAGVALPRAQGEGQPAAHGRLRRGGARAALPAENIAPPRSAMSVCPLTARNRGIAYRINLSLASREPSRPSEARYL